jgi:UDP-N-acetylmuramoyl-tripeptide--D-alanyl-D-alanine ligase
VSPGPTSERPVGGSTASILRFSRPQKGTWRAYAAVGPKTVLLAATRARRRRLQLLPIAVTGSVGKTTTKTLLVAALRTLGETGAEPGGRNRARGLVATVWRASRDTQFLVQEIGASRHGSVDELLWALEPRVAVVTTVRSDHLAGLGGPDGVAREKRKVVAVLPPDGLAVLNADDPRVRAMADAFPGRVVLAGEARDADVRIVGTRLCDDARLELTLALDEREHVVQTRLVGLHWAIDVALAVAAATSLGAEAGRALEAIAAVPPVVERLEPTAAPRGGRFLVDTTKATEASTPPAFSALAALPARRRIAVLGSIWDYVDAGDEEVTERVAREALTVADEVLLYGPAARNAPAGLVDGTRVRAFTSIRALSDEVNRSALPGVVVLLKGTFPYDHLARIAHVATHDVRCWRDDCLKRQRCEACRLLGPRRD